MKQNTKFIFFIFQVTFFVTIFSSPLSVTNGGTGSNNFTNNGILRTNGVDPITATSSGTDGQLLYGSNIADPLFVTPQAGTGLTITTNATTLLYTLLTPVPVSSGGTGVSSVTPYAVLCGGTTATDAFQYPMGLFGQMLASNGTGALPSFKYLYEFAYIYTTTDQNILAGQPYLFESNGEITDNIIHSTVSNTDQIIINKTGIYAFIIMTASSSTGQCAAISINGVVQNATRFGTTNATTIVGISLLSIASGNVIRVVNYSSITISITNTNGSVSQNAASVMIFQVA